MLDQRSSTESEAHAFIDRAILGLLLDDDKQRPWSEVEIAREITAPGHVPASLKRLRTGGLVHRWNDLVTATRSAVLKPGGFFVCVTKDLRTDGALRNLSGETIALCEDAGLLYWQRIIGLLASIRDGELVMRPSFWQMLYTHRRRALGERTHVVAHEDVRVLRKPPARAAKAVRSAPARKAALSDGCDTHGHPPSGQTQPPDLCTRRPAGPICQDLEIGARFCSDRGRWLTIVGRLQTAP